MALEAMAFVKAEWVQPLWKQLERISGERAKEFDRLRDEFVDPNVLKDVYVVPQLQDRNPADSRQDDLVVCAQQSAFERINGFFQGKLPLEKDGRHQMFILSDAGMGKTSLLLMLKLMHLTSFWPQKYSCQLFKLGDDTLQRVRDLPNKGETFLLLDALDEDRQAWKRIKERLLELLAASEDFRRVIISSRTQFFPEMETDSLGRPEIKVLSGYHCPVLYLSPFSNEQVQEFIEKKLPLTFWHRLFLQAKKIRQQRQRANHLLEQMQDLRMRPMLLHHLDKLLELENPQQEWNAYTVYQALINEWLDREVRKLRAHRCGCGRMPERKELFNVCVRIAEWMQRRGEQIISEEELQQLILADENISWLEEFELGGRSLLNRNSERAFRFSHYTIQEFLVAYGIVTRCLDSNKRIRATDKIICFLDDALPDRCYLYVNYLLFQERIIHLYLDKEINRYKNKKVQSIKMIEKSKSINSDFNSDKFIIDMANLDRSLDSLSAMKTSKDGAGDFYFDWHDKPEDLLKMYDYQSFYDEIKRMR